MARAVSDDVRVTRSRDGRVFVFIPEPIGAKLGLIEGRRMAVNVDGREAALTPTDGPGIRLVFAQRSRGARVAFTLSTLPNGAFVKARPVPATILDGALRLQLPEALFEADDDEGNVDGQPRDIASAWAGVDYAPHNLTLRRG